MIRIIMSNTYRISQSTCPTSYQYIVEVQRTRQPEFSFHRKGENSHSPPTTISSFLKHNNNARQYSIGISFILFYSKIFNKRHDERFTELSLVSSSHDYPFFLPPKRTHTPFRFVSVLNSQFNPFFLSFISKSEAIILQRTRLQSLVNVLLLLLQSLQCLAYYEQLHSYCFPHRIQSVPVS